MIDKTHWNHYNCLKKTHCKILRSHKNWVVCIIRVNLNYVLSCLFVTACFCCCFLSNAMSWNQNNGILFRLSEYVGNCCIRSWRLQRENWRFRTRTIGVSREKEEEPKKKLQNWDSGIILNDKNYVFLFFIHLNESKKVYDIAIQHEDVTRANVFINKEGVKDNDLRNKIRQTIRRNQDAVKTFLLSGAAELTFEFLPKLNTRKRSGLNSIIHLYNWYLYWTENSEFTYSIGDTTRSA